MYKNEPRLLKIFSAMKRRCYNKNCSDYKNYGNRGITVCKEWQSFRGFEKDMLPIFKEGLTLDRIDNNGNYEPSNCRWTTRKEQANNRRNTRLFEFNGLKMTMTNWSKKLGINRSTLTQRYYVYGWSIDKCLQTGGY